MDFKVEFKDSFVNDLEQIVRRIAAHNPDAARNLGNLILDRCESLSFFPNVTQRSVYDLESGGSWCERISRFSTE